MNSLKVKKPNFTKEVVLSAEELQLADKIQKLIDDTNATQLINAMTANDGWYIFCFNTDKTV